MTEFSACLKAMIKKFSERVELRYIDVVETDVLGHKDKFDFMNQALNLTINEVPFLNNKLLDINFSNRYVLDDSSYLNLTVATGVNNETSKDAVIWHTFVSNNQIISWDKMEDWIENAHKHASDLFKKLVKPDLYDIFR